MSVYIATFSAVAVSAAQDVFEIVAPSNSRVAIREIALGQYSDAGDAQAELLSVLLIRGHGTAGSGGTVLTPVNLSPYTSALVSGSTVLANNTTVAVTGAGAPKTLRAGVWNLQGAHGGWLYHPKTRDRIVIDKLQRFVVRITAPADAITCNGTIVFEEVGRAGPINA
jgi:hypothetical protein